MKKLKVKEIPCPECPFKNTAVKGWLGPWTPETIFAQVHGEVGLACHMDVTKKGEGHDLEDYRPCYGSLLHANKTCKYYRNQRLARLQDSVADQDTSGILGFEFREYHGKKGYK